MQEPRLILGIGELLWDILPDGPRLGGAPANFAVMASRLGNHAAILSRIGRDQLGRNAVETLGPLPADIGHLQIDATHETGRVSVTIRDNQPEYVIHQAAAWDFLALSDDWVQLAERADAICFGTLAQRNAVSRQTIQELAAETSSECLRIFDVNLRAPFYTAEAVQESLELATVVKMNDAEVPLVLGLLGLPNDVSDPSALRAPAQCLLTEFPKLRLVAITHGSNGSLLVTREEWDQHPGISVKVADTIGAGDAFTAAVAHDLLRGADLRRLNEVGNRWGAWVASQSGAMPPMPEAARDSIEGSIEHGA